MARINFVFGVHLHQPLGNFDHVIESAYQRCYRPFFETVARFEAARLAVHISGCLMEWLDKHHPEFFETLMQLVQRGQLEVLGGGLYEPILPVIPRWDGEAQIMMMSQQIKERFLTSPKGVWVPERVWEPQLASLISKAGIDYAVLDDYHFRAAGVSADALLGYFVTEDAGQRLAVFPISERLRYLMPFGRPHEPIDYLRERASEDAGRLLVMIDDCEKFGVWPGTHKWVFKEGWLEKFLQLLVSSDFITITTPSEYLASFAPKGRVYIPTCSYFEMGEWTLLPDAGVGYNDFLKLLKDNQQLPRFKPFVRGGFWRNFLSKYPESNYMHKRMWMVSEQIRSATVDLKARDSAREDLLRAQCNCGYWHGIFGGLYMPHLRFAIYRNLVRAEARLQRAMWGDSGWVRLSKADIDSDGHDEVVVANPSICCVFSKLGGALVELDCRRSCTNLLDTLARRRETYHAYLHRAGPSGGQGEHVSIHEAKYEADEHILSRLCYDWHPKWSFLDHFLKDGTDIASVRDERFEDLGDFVKGHYDLRTHCSSEVATVEFSREGFLQVSSGKRPFGLVKRYSLDAGSAELCCDYSLCNVDGGSVDVIWGVEFSFACYGDSKDCLFCRNRGDWEPMAEQTKLSNVKGIRLADPYRGFQVELEWDVAAGLMRFPLETVSQSESGFELIKQATTLVVMWRLSFSGDEKKTRRIVVSVKPVQ